MHVSLRLRCLLALDNIGVCEKHVFYRSLSPAILRQKLQSASRFGVFEADFPTCAVRRVNQVGESLRLSVPSRAAAGASPLALPPTPHLGPPKKGLVNLGFIIILNFTYIKLCLLVWDSGVSPLTTDL